MEIEISTSIAGLLRSVPLAEALDTVAAAGYRNVDFPFSVFSRPADSPLKSDLWEHWTQDLGHDLEARGLRVTQAHASWEQAIAQDFSYESPYDVYARTIRACRMLGCGKLVFHAPLYFFHPEDPTVREKALDWNIRWFRELLPILEDNGVTAELENTFDYRHLRKPQDPPFLYTDDERMLELLEGIDSPWVKLCLDTGHANIAGNDPARMIRAYGKRLDVLHLNDNLGFIDPIYEDLHLFPGHGTVRWQEVFQALYETGFSYVFNMEPVGALARLSKEARVLQFRAAGQLVTQMAREAGF